MPKLGFVLIGLSSGIIPVGFFFVFEINITGGIENLFLRVLSRVQYSFHKSDVYFLGTHPSLILTN